MLNLQPIVPTNSAKDLADTIKPYQILNTLKWEHLLNKKQRNGLLQYFVQSYLTTLSAEALISFAAEQAALRNENLGLFIDWAKIHAIEERDHHKWYLDDLIAIGFQRPELENLIADDIVLELLGVQFALIATAHPVSILGYLFVSEGYKPEPAQVYELAQRFSIPNEGIRTILYHVEADKAHQKEIVELIDRYSSNDFLYGTIQKAAIETIVGWTKYFTKLAKEETQEFYS